MTHCGKEAILARIGVLCVVMLTDSRRPGTARKLFRLVAAALPGLLAAVLMFGSVKSAQAGAALVLNPTVSGPLLPAEQSAIESAIKDAIRSQQFELIAPSDLETAIAGEPQLKDCDSDLCFERLGRLLASQLVVRYRLKVSQPAGKQKNADWHLNVELLDVEIGAMGARLTEDCSNCTGQAAAAQLSDMVKRAMFQTASLPRGTLEIRSQPPGAAVFVDGTELGITPYKRAAFAGKHKVVLRHTGFRSQQTDTTVEDGQKQKLDLTLSPGADPVQVVVVEREKTPIYKKWWFWVAIGGGAAAAAAITAGIVVGTRGSAAADPMIPSNTYMFPF